MNRAVEGILNCPVHARVEIKRAEVKSLNIYRIKKFERRLVEMKEATGARSLDEELALLRMVLEEVLNKCDSGVDLLLYSERIMDLISQVRATVQVAEKLATRTGMLVGRAEALQIAGTTVEIIARHIENDTLLAKIAEDLQMAFLSPLNNEL